MIITTSRLILRPMMAEDLEPLLAMTSDPQVMAFVGDGQTLDRAATALWIENAAAALRASDVGSRAVVLRDSGKVIGWAGIIPTAVQGRVELIYGFSRAYWGRGYASEATAALLEASDAGPIDATIDPNNGPSRRILEKLGFAAVGEEQDEHGLPTLRLRRP
ncbi:MULTISPECIES: GNAT family N-acetyltransferase [Phenylobacterium]|uniref:Ribosomal-protein-alanine N-acetyltransferase n=1 Tax=Phenylobacterium koreense TaxID=266125 RepID=A0ABV2EFB3_9CAUL